jgi:hypothetical protein
MIKNANKNAIVREEFLEVSIFWYNMFLRRKFMFNECISWSLYVLIDAYSVIINALYLHKGENIVVFDHTFTKSN